MRKIPTLYLRDPQDRRRLTREVTPGCEWVLAGEGVATRKYDGTAVMVRDGIMFKRAEVKPGRSEPPGFEQVDVDETTGKRFGWLPVGDGPEDKWHRAAKDEPLNHPLVDGTYELLGPKIQGNPEGFDWHALQPHAGAEQFEDAPRDYEGLRRWLHRHPYEGIVFHHPDGRMAKIKRRDFKGEQSA